MRGLSSSCGRGTVLPINSASVSHLWCELQSSNTTENSILVYIFSCKSVCPTQPAHSTLQNHVEGETFDSISSVAHLILNYASRLKRFSIITVLPYAQTQTHIHISKSLGFRHKVSHSPEAPKSCYH